MLRLETELNLVINCEEHNIMSLWYIVDCMCA